MDTTATARPLDKRRKEARPEYIDVGGERFERQDLTAARFGASERTISRGDARGAPYRFFSGCKYRPVKLYDQFVLATIERLIPQTPKRKRRRTLRAAP